MTPEFYLILSARDIDDALADRVYEAGFDDSSLTMRGGHAAVWVTQREGKVIEVVREAIAQAARASLDVLRVEITPESFTETEAQ